MKAVTRSQYGDPSVLRVEEVDIPQIADDELLVKVHATTVSRTDCGILTASPWLIRLFTGIFKPKHRTPGTDFAGEITKVGSKVKEFKVGQRVFGLNDEGLCSQAEYLVINKDSNVVPIPDNTSFIDAAASAEGAHYAINFINKVKLESDNKVLVYGASGAIGSAAVQILKAQGIYVTAVVNTKNMDEIRKRGADKLWNYETEDFTKDPERYDFIFDAVGKSSFGECKKILKAKGIYISSELGPRAENLYLPFLTRLKGGKRVIFPIPRDCKTSLTKMASLLEKDQFKPLIDRTYTISEIVEAYTYVMSGQKSGNVIVCYV